MSFNLCRPTCSEILQHPWLKQEGHGSDKPLDNVVLSRMKNFAAMHKLKKTALMVVGACLSAEEIAGMKRLFKTIDADGSGTITVKELQVFPATRFFFLWPCKSSGCIQANFLICCGTCNHVAVVSVMLGILQLGILQFGLRLGAFQC